MNSKDKITQLILSLKKTHQQMLIKNFKKYLAISLNYISLCIGLSQD